MKKSYALPVATSDGKNMTAKRRRLLIVPAVAVITLTLVLMGSGSASAASDPDPVGHLLTGVHTTLHPSGRPSAKAPSSKAPSSKAPSAKAPSAKAPSSRMKEDRNGAGSARSSATTDYASSSAGHLEAADSDLLDVSKNDSSGTQDATAADATLLAIGGTTLIGSQARSGGANEGHSALPQVPVCQPTDGAVCLDLLYADSSATDADGSSSADTSTGVADACIAGDGVSDGTCDGQHVGLVQGTSGLDRSGTGHNTATSWTSMANFCLQPGAEGCTADGNVLSSRGRSDTESGGSTSSTLAQGDLAGTPASAPGDPLTVAVPADCDSPSLACVFLNQGDDGVSGPLTRTSRAVVEISGLGGEAGGSLAEARSGTSSVEDTSVVSPPTHGQARPPASTTTKASTADVAGPVAGGLLPNTGGVWSDLISIGLLLVGAGATAMAWTRRRHTA